MKTKTAAPAVPNYEQKLGRQRDWAMDEADRYFRRDSDVFRTMRAVAERLDSLSLPYTVAGAMAMFAHGFRRFTEDVNLLVRREGLRTIHERLEGFGYWRPFAGSRNLRETERGVRIEFLVTGDYPGDGKPKPIAFPDPAEVAIAIDGIQYLSLPTLVELKLASGMTHPARLKDLGDAQEMIRILGLPAEFAETLNPYVGDKYLELWRGVQEGAADPWS